MEAARKRNQKKLPAHPSPEATDALVELACRAVPKILKAERAEEEPEVLRGQLDGAVLEEGRYDEDSVIDVGEVGGGEWKNLVLLIVNLQANGALEDDEGRGDDRQREADVPEDGRRVIRKAVDRVSRTKTTSEHAQEGVEGEDKEDATACAALPDAALNLDRLVSLAFVHNSTIALEV